MYALILGFVSLVLIAVPILTIISGWSLNSDILKPDAWPDKTPKDPKNKPISDKVTKEIDFAKHVVFWVNIGASSLGVLVLIGLLVAMFHKTSEAAGPGLPGGYDANMPPINYQA